VPQYELDSVGPKAVSGLVRARTAEDAVRSTAELSTGMVVEIAETDDPAGWCEVTIAGLPRGRLRAHARMRFRRD
jgi:hypothetical protein